MDPAVDARVMATVHAMPRHQTARSGRGWLAWLTQPQTVRFSPLGAMAAMAVVVAAVVMVPRLSPDDGAERVDATAPMREAERSTGSDSTHMVQFVFVAPTAHSVSLVGDFNNWEMDATPLSAGPSRSVWTVRLPLANGRHRYAFVVDDSTWAADPSAPPAAGDDFGVPSSVITVAERSS